MLGCGGWGYCCCFCRFFPRVVLVITLLLPFPGCHCCWCLCKRLLLNWSRPVDSWVRCAGSAIFRQHLQMLMMLVIFGIPMWILSYLLPYLFQNTIYMLRKFRQLFGFSDSMRTTTTTTRTTTLHSEISGDTPIVDDPSL